ncbi:MAG TPA: DDE-type integrase/transposase/recombinase [Acidobacteriota bacterium]
MPWKERSTMDERVRFVLALESGVYQMAELCRRYGISRQCGYKWWQRYQEGGWDEFEEQSRAPRHCPHRVNAAIVEVMLQERRRFGYGGKKIIARLRQNQPAENWPSPATADKYFRQNGLSEKRRRRRQMQPQNKPLLNPAGPNDIWTADFKGEFRLGNGQYCYPLTATDSYSRYLLGCHGLESTRGKTARAVFEQLFSHYGLPAAILTDNGGPFGQACSLGRLSRLSVWWIKLGIVPLRIQPGHPEQNPRHERMHRELKKETTRPPAQNFQQQQDKFDQFCRCYNQERPHEGIQMNRPNQLYQASERRYDRREVKLEYPGHYLVRRVRGQGLINWRGKDLFISEVLSGEYVGFEAVDDGIWSVYLGTYLLGRLDEATRKIYA